MDMSAASAWFWIVVGVGLAILLLVAAAVVVLPRRRTPRTTASRGPADGGFGEDDLPGFLERPPGSAGNPAGAPAGWVALSAEPRVAATASGRRSRIDRRTGRILAAAAVAAVLLLATAVVVEVASTRHEERSRSGEAAARRYDGRPAERSGWDAQRPRDGRGPRPAVPSAPPPGSPGAGALAAESVPLGRNGVAADLAFDGVVLEQHAVGITATYPRLRLTSDGSDAVAHLEFPAYNCLSAEAPADPVAAGCSRAVAEYADLAAPALTVSRSRGGQLRITGRFPTYIRPNGTPPDWTGRAYELRITVAPVDRRPGAGRVHATGELRLGAGRAATTGVSVLRFGG